MSEQRSGGDSVTLIEQIRQYITSDGTEVRRVHHLDLAVARDKEPVLAALAVLKLRESGFLREIDAISERYERRLEGASAPVAEAGDRFLLCMMCGVIRPLAEWTWWQQNMNEATEHNFPWMPSKPGQTDPMGLCPACSWEHRDTDDGSGFYEGSLAEMSAQHAAELPEMAEAWAHHRSRGDS